MYHIERSENDYFSLECRKCNNIFDIPATSKGMRSNFVCTSCKIVKSKKISKGAHGLSEKQYYDLLKDQGGKCAICCRTPDKTLHVDHCHKTGLVRGLLCSNCNIALGNFKDDVQALHNAIKYLQRDRGGSPMHAAFTKIALRQAE